MFADFSDVAVWLRSRFAKVFALIEFYMQHVEVASSQLIRCGRRTFLALIADIANFNLINHRQLTLAGNLIWRWRIGIVRDFAISTH